MPQAGLNTHHYKTKKNEAQPLLGEVRRFGIDGILYEVIALLDQRHVEISVLDTGEKLSYPISDVMKDPHQNTPLHIRR